MNQEKNNVAIRVMDVDFHVKCTTEQIPELHKAAKYLNIKINEIKDSNTKIINKNNLIVIASLNIINDLFAQKKQNNLYVDETNKEIANIQNFIESNLADNKETEV